MGRWGGGAAGAAAEWLGGPVQARWAEKGARVYGTVKIA